MILSERVSYESAPTVALILSFLVLPHLVLQSENFRNNNGGGGGGGNANANSSHHQSGSHGGSHRHRSSPPAVAINGHSETRNNVIANSSLQPMDISEGKTF